MLAILIFQHLREVCSVSPKLGPRQTHPACVQSTSDNLRLMVSRPKPKTLSVNPKSSRVLEMQAVFGDCELQGWMVSGCDGAESRGRGSNRVKGLGV